VHQGRAHHAVLRAAGIAQEERQLQEQSIAVPIRSLTQLIDARFRGVGSLHHRRDHRGDALLDGRVRVEGRRAAKGGEAHEQRHQHGKDVRALHGSTFSYLGTGSVENRSRMPFRTSGASSISK
jgi:hypothetical protein